MGSAAQDLSDEDTTGPPDTEPLDASVFSDDRGSEVDSDDDWVVHGGFSAALVVDGAAPEM
eukprot:9466982-Pyramimonas_sp.AAC.1